MAIVFPGLCSAAVGHLEPAEVIELAAAAGLEAVEWGGDRHVPPGATRVAERLGERCRAAGVATPSYGSFLVAGAPDTDDDVVAVTLDTAVALRAPNVRVWTPLGEPPSVQPRRRLEITRAVAAVAEAAARRSLTVSLEFNPATLTRTAASTLQLLDDVGSDVVFTTWQPVWPAPDGEEPMASLAALVHRMSHVYVHHRYAAVGSALADGAEVLAPALELVRNAFGTWAGARVALLAAVAGDTPDEMATALAADAATLGDWV